MWPGEVLVATSDRDAFQLASDRVTVLQPTKGVSEMARIDPAGCGSGTASSRSRCRISSRCAATPRTSSPAPGAIGPKKAADVLREFGSLEAALAAGRFATEAEDLRLYRRIAAMDASAPLPPLADQSPTWAEASTFIRSLGLNALADRLAGIGDSFPSSRAKTEQPKDAGSAHS